MLPSVQMAMTAQLDRRRALYDAYCAVPEHQRAEVIDGTGPQSNASVTVTLAAGDAQKDRWQGRVGFRTVTMNVAPDEYGGPFVLSVNDRPVYVRGANWIPDDAFVTRLDRDTYQHSIRDAVDANMNLLRVWGGGIYESEDFYDLCHVVVGGICIDDYAVMSAAFVKIGFLKVADFDR